MAYDESDDVIPEWMCIGTMLLQNDWMKRPWCWDAMRLLKISNICLKAKKEEWRNLKRSKTQTKTKRTKIKKNKAKKKRKINHPKKESETKIRLKLMEKLLTLKMPLSHYFGWRSHSYAKRKIHLLSLGKDLCAGENHSCCHL